jgi:hypothetical protein
MIAKKIVPLLATLLLVCSAFILPPAPAIADEEPAAVIAGRLPHRRLP